ncbi:MAG: signal peptidase II [Anaerolineae bacterium]|nr:signal peptidase II [Anaerolineae bacterium]
MDKILMRRRWILLFVIIAGMLAVDQVTKWLVVHNLIPYETVRPIPALAPFFQLTYIENTGSAFGFLPQAGDLFLIIAVVVVAAMIYFYPRVPANGRITRIAIGLISGGALGNALDRLQYGHVVDFIHYQVPGLISNVSNLADHAIVIGVILIFIESWLHDRQAKAAHPVALGADPRDDR